MRRTSVIPARFNQEPCDIRGYDRWQDAEGLTDATDKTKQAWVEYLPSWRAIRAQDLKTDDTEGTGDLGMPFPDDLKGVGRANGSFWCPGSRPTSKPAVRRSWWIYRSRVLRADPDVWSMLCQAADGESLGIIAARYGQTPRYVQAVLALVFRWWREEVEALERLERESLGELDGADVGCPACPSAAPKVVHSNSNCDETGLVCIG